MTLRSGIDTIEITRLEQIRPAMSEWRDERMAVADAYGGR